MGDTVALLAPRRSLNRVRPKPYNQISPIISVIGEHNQTSFKLNQASCLVLLPSPELNRTPHAPPACPMGLTAGIIAVGCLPSGDAPLCSVSRRYWINGFCLIQSRLNALRAHDPGSGSSNLSFARVHPCFSGVWAPIEFTTLQVGVAVPEGFRPPAVRPGRSGVQSTSSGAVSQPGVSDPVVWPAVAPRTNLEGCYDRPTECYNSCSMPASHSPGREDSA